MAIELTRLLVRVDADVSGIQRNLNAVQSAVNNLASSAQSLGRSLTIGVTAPLAALGGLSVSAAADMDRLTRGLTAVTGSAEETERQLERLEAVARLPGLGFREAIQGSIRLQSVRLSAELSERALIAFGNAVAIAGGGKAELDGITLALSQIAGKGKVAAEEINQIAERAPQVRAALIDAFGTADTEVIQKAGLSTTEFLQRLIAELEKLPRAGGGAANSFENLSDSMYRLRAAIGQQLLPVIMPLVDGLARMMETARTLDPATVRLGIAFAAVAATVGPLIGTLGALAQAFIAVKVAGHAAALTLGAGGLLVVGLGLLGGLFIKNKLDALAAAGAVDRYTASLGTLAQSSAEYKLRDLSRQAEELRSRLAATPKEIQRIVSMSATGRVTKTTPIANPEYAKIADELRTVNQQYGIVARRLTDIRLSANQASEGIQPLTVKIQGATAAASEMQQAVQALDTTLRSSTVVGLSDFTLRVGGIEVDPEALERFKEDMRRRLELTAALDLELKKVEVPNAPSSESGGSGAFASIIGALSTFGASLKAQLIGLAASFGPLAVAAAVLAPVFQGLKDAVGPALTALAIPLRVVGQVLGALLVPALRLLFPPLKYFGILVAMVGEGIARVLGWFLDAVAAIIQGIGGFIKRLGELIPGWLGGNKIEKFGKGIIEAGDYVADAAAGARATARELEKTQEELKGLSFEEAMKGATDAVKEFTAATSNMPAIFDLALRRRQAALGGAAPPAVGGGLTPGTVQPTDTGGSLPASGPVIQIINPAPGVNGREIVETVKRAFRSDPELRYLTQRAVGVAV